MNNISELLLLLVQNKPHTISCNDLVYSSTNYVYIIHYSDCIILTIRDNDGNCIYKRAIDCDEKTYYQIKWQIEDWLKYFETQAYLELDEFVAHLSKPNDAFDELVEN